MPEDQTLDTEDSAQDDQGQEDQTPESGQVDDQQQKPFTPEQEQYMGSWMGRIISKQFEEKVLPALQQSQPQFQDRQVNEGDALDEVIDAARDMRDPFQEWLDNRSVSARMIVQASQAYGLELTQSSVMRHRREHSIQ